MDGYRAAAPAKPAANPASGVSVRERRGPARRILPRPQGRAPTIRGSRGMSEGYRVACLPCNEAATIGHCPCADEGQVCPHPLFHPDFAGQAFRERRVVSAVLQGLFGQCRSARRARGFTDHAGEPVEDWMLWWRWDTHIGCKRCAERGRDAPCWGRAACHGYYEGCGCDQCWAEELEAKGEGEIVWRSSSGWRLMLDRCPAPRRAAR